MTSYSGLIALSTILATYVPTCRPPQVAPTETGTGVPLRELWEQPDDLAARDLFYGPWGIEHAPAPDVVYTFVKPKTTGMNPGMTVRDPRGRRWSVKQASYNGLNAEGPVEVVLSRVLSAVGYHQPPVYFLSSFTLADTFGRRTEPGGRFRLDLPAIKDRGEWSWQENPFVGTVPYQGLLVVLMMFNASDLKNENNTLYETPGSPNLSRWFVVRDLGMALGRTGRVTPPRGDPEIFARTRFIRGMRDGYVVFDYRGFHQELVRNRITPDEVRWACDLLAGLSERQWYDAFRAGGYDAAVSGRFIRQLQARIAEGRALGGQSGAFTP
jgi:hypothetical protein